MAPETKAQPSHFKHNLRLKKDSHKDCEKVPLT